MRTFIRFGVLLQLLVLAACGSAGTAQFRLEQVGPASSLPPGIVPDMRYWPGPLGIVVMVSSEADLFILNHGFGELQLAVELCPALARLRPIWDGDRSRIDNDGINDEFGHSLGRPRLFGSAVRRPDGRISYWIPIRSVTPRRDGVHRVTRLPVQNFAEHDMRRDPRDICITLADLGMTRAARFSNTLVIPAATIHAVLQAGP